MQLHLKLASILIIGIIIAGCSKETPENTPNNESNSEPEIIYFEDNRGEHGPCDGHNHGYDSLPPAICQAIGVRINTVNECVRESVVKHFFPEEYARQNCEIEFNQRSR